jgi:hypothetical protein
MPVRPDPVRDGSPGRKALLNRLLQAVGFGRVMRLAVPSIGRPRARGLV